MQGKQDSVPYSTLLRIQPSWKSHAVIHNGHVKSTNTEKEGEKEDEDAEEVMSRGQEVEMGKSFVLF